MGEPFISEIAFTATTRKGVKELKNFHNELVAYRKKRIAEIPELCNSVPNNDDNIIKKISLLTDNTDPENEKGMVYASFVITIQTMQDMYLLPWNAYIKAKAPSIKASCIGTKILAKRQITYTGEIYPRFSIGKR